jgi:hypothetical protein
MFMGEGLKLRKYFVADMFGFDFGRTSWNASRMIFTLPELSPGSGLGVR